MISEPESGGEKEALIYSFAPICDEKSRILILGTMASPASLRCGMYYGHPRNAFWRIISGICGEPEPGTNDEKRALLLRNGIALWDTLRSCRRRGALDNDIESEQPNDVPSLLRRCPAIKAVFLNGGAAYGYYKKYFSRSVALEFFRLPSTSPANARMRAEEKAAAWREATEKYLG
jgi:TDG/mug DNA glycosylase family protein